MLLVIGSALLSPPAAWAKGCSQGDPAVPVPEALWGVLRPTRIIQDATRYQGTQWPGVQFPVTTWIDIENGWLFVSMFGGFQIWDATGTKQTAPQNATTVNLETQFPIAPHRGEVREFVFAIDAPEGDDSIVAVGGIEPVGVSIWDTANKANPVVLFQDSTKFVHQVYATKIGGRDYVFAASFGGTSGLHVYDMTAARPLRSCTSNCPGVYQGRLGDRPAKYVHGVQVGNRHFVAATSGDLPPFGMELWEVTNPVAPQRLLSTSGVVSSGVAMWNQSGRTYMAIRKERAGEIYDVTTCVTGGCSSPQLVASVPLLLLLESTNWQSVAFSRSGTTPMLYFGNYDLCRQGDLLGATEYLYDVTNASAPELIKPPGTMVAEGELLDETVDYWSWYYSTFNKGFSQMAPRGAKFNGAYLYRSAGTIFDIHEWTAGGSLPPTASFTWSPAEIYPGDPVTFTDTSIGTVTSRAWTFADATPPSSNVSPQVVSFSTPGVKGVSLAVNGAGADSNRAQNVTVLNPSPAVAAAGAAPASPLVCQPVTLTATGVTGKAPLGQAWEVKNGQGASVATGAGNPFTWNTTGQSAGSYTATFTASNGSGSASQSVPVTLSPLPPLPAALSFLPTNDPFAAGTVQFHVNVAGATSWRWDFGDGQILDTSDPVAGPNPVHSYTSIGQKTVKVTVKNCVETAGVESAPLSVNVTQVAPLNVLSFIASGCQIFCDFSPNQTITFVQTFEGSPTGYEYDWNGDNEPDQTSPTPITTHAYSTQGLVTPQVRAVRGAETTPWFAHPLPINIRTGGGNPNPNPNPNPGGPSVTINGPSSGQVSQALSFSASFANCTAGNTWSWTAAGGTITGNGSQQVQISWPSAGNKSISVTNPGCQGTTGTKSVNISAGNPNPNPNPGGLAASFTFTPANPNPGQAVTFDGSSSSGTPTIYFWSFGDGQSANTATASHVFQSPGAYDVKLTVAKNCDAGVCQTAETTKRVVVAGQALTAGFSTSANCIADFLGERCEAEVGQAVSFSSTSSGGANSFSWTFNDGTPAVTGPQATHTWRAPGSYLVQLTVGNGAASASTSRLFVVTGELVAALQPVVMPWIAQSDAGALDQSSDLYIHNPSGDPLKVKLQFLKRGTPEATPPTSSRTIQPGATLFFSDVVSDLFDRENLTGFVLVTVEEGSIEPIVTSFNTTLQDDGTRFGQTIPGFTLGSSEQASTTGKRIYHLVGLSDNAEKFAYFGVSNPNAEKVTYRYRILDENSVVLGTSPEYTVSKFGQRQFGIGDLRALGATGHDDFRIELEASAAILPYAAILRTGSEDPSFVEAGDSSTSKVYLVGALSTRGINNSQWQSDAVLANVTSQVVITDVSFTSLGVASVPTDKVKITLQPGESRRLANVLPTQWGVNDAIGVLTFESDSPNGVFPAIQGESFDVANPTEKFGQAMSSQSEADAAGTGRAQYLVGLRQDAEYRTTLWVFNPSNQPGIYQLVYRALDGTVLGRVDLSAGPGKMRQVSPGQHPLPKAGAKDGFTIEVKVTSGKVLAAAQVVNNATNDPAYIRGERR